MFVHTITLEIGWIPGGLRVMFGGMFVRNNLGHDLLPSWYSRGNVDGWKGHV